MGDRDIQRRTLLRHGAAVVALGFAGCAGGSDDGAEPSPTASPSVGPTRTDAPAGGSGEPATTVASSPTPTASPTATPAGGPTAAQTVVVGPGGSLRFEPAGFRVGVGDAGRWTWDSSGHNVRPSATPAGAEWTGTAGGDPTTSGAGHTYRYGFEVAGPYEYDCAPHRPAGMTGTFTVV